MATAVATQEQDKHNGSSVNLTITNGVWQASDWQSLYYAGTVLAKSQWTPEHFRGKAGECAICVIMASRVGMDPVSFMQSTYAVHGKIGLEAKLAIALLRKSGAIKGTIRYELTGEGEKRQCTASVIDKESGETYSETVTFEMAKAEGWVDKKGSKWRTIPDLMLKYRSATFLIRTLYPDVLMGLNTVDELQDMQPVAPLEGSVVSQPRTLEDLKRQFESTQDESGEVENDDEDTAEFEPSNKPEPPEDASPEELEEIEKVIGSLKTSEAVCDMAEHLAGQHEGDEGWCAYIDSVAQARLAGLKK